jgi:hypothetical protein
MPVRCTRWRAEETDLAGEQACRTTLEEDAASHSSFSSARVWSCDWVREFYIWK